MKLRTVLIVLIVLIIGGFLYFSISKNKETQEPTMTESKIASGNMKLTSSAFTNNQNIPAKYTCDGENVNPPLTISDIPENAKSLALIMDDPDAPAGTWVHWTLWNLDPNTQKIAENSLPTGAVEGKTSFGKPGYSGPCPPSGTHHYFFKLYALDATLPLSQNATKGDLEKEMTGHIIQKTELVGLYSRQ